MRKSSYVLDASAVLAYLVDEDGSEKVEKLFTEAHAGSVTVLMHNINICEVYYCVYRAEGQSKALEVFNAIAGLPIMRVGSLEDGLLMEAGRIKVKYGVSLADSIAIALARLAEASLVTADHHELDAVNSAGEVSFFWIR